MQGVTLTVSELNDYVRRSLASDPILHNITISGEISNFKAYTSGHWYFTLKDDLSRIDCAMFRQHNYNVQFLPRDGMKVLVKGSAGLYVQSGKYQFYAESMQQSGLGELYQRYMELKDKLTREGLFDAARKRPLPLLPRKVGIVTSASGAVLHDIRTVAGRRFPGLELVLRPAQVQGEGSAQDIARGVMEVSAVPGVDVVIVGRGGGSMEDLWSFNEEVVVRAVAACPVPVISAVGHETDHTLCDLAADMRAPTPSAAAELAVPEREALINEVDGMVFDLRRAAENAVLVRQNSLSAMEKRLTQRDPRNVLKQMLLHCGHLSDKLQMEMQRQLTMRESRLDSLIGKIDAVGPAKVLRRGYTIAMKKNTPVTSVEAATGDMTLLFSDGRASVRVMSTERGKMFGSQEETDV
ncbi:MAG: exodeoxyribonuclease VII large subunit [Clostridia bacterium]|nr:exodeoxyribonuclease VII large subunit [Clostridia bacterium]